MRTPSKRRKLNDGSKTSPAAPARNLDFFFGQQRQGFTNIQSSTGEQSIEDPQDESHLTDEQLARKLQAEWDRENVRPTGNNGTLTTEARNTSPISPHQEHSIVGEAEVGLDRPGDIDNPVKTEIRVVNTKSEGTSTPDTYPEAAGDSLPTFICKSNDKNTLSLQSTGSAEDIITSTIPFDESPLIFEPSKYVAGLQSHWAAEGGSASYALLTRCFVLVNSTQSRIKIVDTLVNLLRIIIEGDPSSLLPTVRIMYCYFRIRPVLSSCDMLVFSRYCYHVFQIISPILTHVSGMVSYELYFSSLYFTRARIGGLGNFESTKDCMWARQQVSQSSI